MIIKLIEAKGNPAGAQAYARRLARYFVSGDRRMLGADSSGLDYGLTLSAYMNDANRTAPSNGERVLFGGARIGGLSCDWDEGLAEVERRLAKRSGKTKKPVRHVILSCRKGEHLTSEGCVSAIDMLADELGCQAGAMLWAAHGDTDNFHLHITVVTVDPATGGALPFGQTADGRAGWKEAMQRSIARIEQAQALQAEAGARYRMEGEAVVRIETPRPKSARRTPIRQEIRQWEEQSGFASFTRFAQEVAGPILDDAASWDGLHRALAPHGIAIRPAVNGGELHAGDERVKLSNVDRAHSWGRLVKRLGDYEPAADIIPAAYTPRMIDADKAARWLQGQRQRRAIAERIDARLATLLAMRDAAIADACAGLSVGRADLAGFDGDPRLRQDLAGAFPRLRASILSAIRIGFAGRIAAVRALRHAAAEQDDAGTVDLGAIDLDAIGTAEGAIVAPWFGDRRAGPVALAGYDADRSGDLVRYWRRVDPHRHGQPALVDAGSIIWVNDRSDHAVAAALTLAQARYGKVAIFGDAAYLRQSRRVAAGLGIAVTIISVAEAKARSRAAQQGRLSARERALETLALDQAESHRRWLRAWRRAERLRLRDGGPDRLSGPVDTSVPLMMDLAHHMAVPKVAAGNLPVVAATDHAQRSVTRPPIDPGIG